MKAHLFVVLAALALALVLAPCAATAQAVVGSAAPAFTATDSQENAYLAQMHADPTAVLMDAGGKLGHLYGAKTTPEMYVIDPNGKLIYEGAIDDRPTPDISDIKGADNYLNDALTAAMAGKPVIKSYTRPYGCSVKYPE